MNESVVVEEPEALTVLIVGPMYGYTDDNSFQFNSARRMIREKLGHSEVTVYSPTDLWDGEPHSRQWYLQQTIVQLCEMDPRYSLVVTLPNWRESAGATLEVAVAHQFGIPVLPLERVDEFVVTRSEREER